MSEQSTVTLIRAPKSPQEINSTTLLGVCASLKPAPGYPSRSAARSILSNALDTVATVYPDIYLLDLRDHPPPFFDGRMPEKYDDASLNFVRECIERAGGLLLSVPAYWSSVSGVFKNFIDVACGPVYDMGDSFTTIFTNKFVGLVVVGADEASAHSGADQACQIMLSTGANLVSNPIVFANPRVLGPKMETLLQEVVATGAVLARHILQANQNSYTNASKSHDPGLSHSERNEV